jgi:hypothetical protein
MPSDKILKLANKLVEARHEHTKLKNATTEAEKTRRNLELRLYEQMELEGIQNFKHERLGTFYRSHRVWCRIGDEARASSYFRKHRIFNEIMHLKPQSGRLNQWIKEKFLDQGMPVPEVEIGIEVTISPKIGRRKGSEELD